MKTNSFFRRTLAGLVFVASAAFAFEQAFNTFDTLSDVKRKLNESGVTVANLTALHGGALTPSTVVASTSVTTPSLTIDSVNGTAITKMIMGSATLSSGIATVSNTNVTANSLIFLANRVGSATTGFLTITNLTANTSFKIISSNTSSTNTVAWLLLQP